MERQPELIELVEDAFDLDAEDVLGSPAADTWGNREFAGAIATLITAILDGKDPTGLNAYLNEKFGYQGGHTQPHEKPVTA